MPNQLKIPDFANETEEAQWWYDHRDDLAGAFEEAAARDDIRVGSAARLAREHAAAETIRLDPGDISRARALAARHGLPYTTYLQMLVHDALASEQKKLTS
jgi:predicted DNA binding CopG/RHH family protein